MSGEAAGNSKIEILVTLDENYIPPLMTMLKSLFASNGSESFRIWLLQSSISSSEIDRLAAYCKRCGAELQNVSVNSEVFDNAPIVGRYTREMYYRLLAPVLLPESLDRVLYIDPDVLVINPVRPLWETELQGNMFAAAIHTGSLEFENIRNRERLGLERDYFNSGVMLMDLTKCRKEIVPEDIFKFTALNKEGLLFPDQDIINCLYGDSIAEVSETIWNYDARLYDFYLEQSGGKRNLEWVIENTVCLHFCGAEKPWKEGYNLTFGSLYRHYMRLRDLT